MSTATRREAIITAGAVAAGALFHVPWYEQMSKSPRAVLRQARWSLS